MNLHIELHTQTPSCTYVLSRLTIALALSFAAAAHAAPTGGTVAAGSATISASGTNTTITQTTPKAVVNWQGFDVQTAESVRFVQPNSSAVILNRVNSAQASQIQGKVTANGRVFLVNPNGIIFGQGSQVNVGGMVASTREISDANFLAGNYQFSGDSSATISNQGSISTNADGGYVALLGANVSNDGLINARLGTVALAAGNTMTLDVAGDKLLNVTVDQGAVDAMVRNGHMIKADGGQVLMTAKGAGNLMSNAVNNTGVIQAQSIQTKNGSIRLMADASGGVVNVSGSVDASGPASGSTGGKVEILGKTVNLVNAKVTASGNAGGGKVSVGGNVKGQGPLPNSQYTNVNSGTVINADATQAGHGGQIVIWSDVATVMGGTLTARGGALSGDGGFIETSGKQLTLTDTASIITLAPNGKTGIWLLDPVNWTIATLGGDETPAQVATSLASSDRTITADNNITVSDPITWSTSQDLTLNAGNNVLINAAITASTAGARLNIIAGNDALITGVLTASGAANQINITATRDITSSAAITASALNTQVNINSGRDISTTVVTTDGGGSMDLRANRNITIATASAAASPGTVTLWADKDGTGPGVQGGTVTIGTGVTATNTIIRFNPATYATTATEVASYTAKIVGTKDIKAWVFTQANDKVYDASTTATLAFNGTPTDASAVTLNAGTASFNTKDVGTDKTVTYAGYSLGGTATNLALFAASGTHLADITPVPLTVSATGTNKVYDGTTADAVTLSATVYAGDTVTLGNSAATFVDKNVGTAKTVNVPGITLTGADAANYTPNSSTTTTANITPATLTIYATGSDKPYDGTTTATVALSDNRIAGDSFTTSNSGANFSSARIGTNKTVTVTGISATGTDAGNYTYSPTTTTTASITSPVANASGGTTGGTSSGGTTSATTADQINATVMGQLAVVPTSPLTTGGYAPIVLRRDTEYGGITSTPIVPLSLLGITSVEELGAENGMNAGPASSTLMLGTRPSHQPGILIVSQSNLPPELLTLYPAQPLKPVGPYVAPVRLPRQGRN